MVNNKLYDKDKFNQSGVYQMNCKNCNSRYLGQSRRNFELGLKNMSDFGTLIKRIKCNKTREQLDVFSSLNILERRDV